MDVAEVVSANAHERQKVRFESVRPTRLKTLGFRLFSIGLGLVVAVMAVEVALRVFWPQPTGPVEFSFDPVRGGIPTPNRKARRTLPGVYEYTYSNNSLGLRGPEIGPKTRPRVLLLGDSFTYGIGVNDDQTFASRLQGLTGAEIINGGNSGTGTDYALRFYEVMGRSFNSDLVVLCFFPNDFQNNQWSTYYDAEFKPRDLSQTTFAKKSFLNNPIYNWLLTHSHVINLVKVNLIHAHVWETNTPIEESKIDFEATRRYIKALEARVREANARLLIVYLPGERDLDDYRSGQRSKFEQALQSIHTAFSVTPALADSEFRNDQLYFPEGHWTVAAHQRAAEGMAPLIRSELSSLQNRER